MPLACHLAQRYKRQHEPIDDLVQVASIGLVKAVDRFDSARGAAFSTFAVPTILGELKRYFRDCGWAMHVPRGTQERMLKVSAITARLSRRLGRSPTTAEIVEASGLSREQVVEAMEASVAARPTSLELAIEADEASGDSPVRSIGAEDERFALVDDRDAIARGLGELSERDRLIVQLRFAGGLTQSQIAARVGISQMQVSRVLRRALNDVRTHAEGSSAPTAADALEPVAEVTV